MRSWIWILLVALVMVSCGQPRVVRVAHSTVAMDEGGDSEAGRVIADLIDPYRMDMEAEMNAVIGEVGEVMPKGYPESLLGNWVADALAIQARIFTGKPIDFALANSGGLRIPELAAGPLKRGTIYELLPFDNVLVVVEIPGAVVLELANHMAARGGWPVSSAFRMTIQEETAAEVKIGGQALEPNSIYRVAMPDYVANGGDDCSFLEGLAQESTGFFMRDAVLEFIERKNKEGMVLRSAIEGRVMLVKNQ